MSPTNIVCDNRRARYFYHIESNLEAGIVLCGAEVKSLRNKSGISIAEAYATIEKGELWLVNSHIPEYKFAAAGYNNDSSPRRPRKLLITKREIKNISKNIHREGMTIVPLRIYFNHKGCAKISIGIAKGKKLHDKREALRKKDWDRKQQRLVIRRNK